MMIPGILIPFLILQTALIITPGMPKENPIKPAQPKTNRVTNEITIEAIPKPNPALLLLSLFSLLVIRIFFHNHIYSFS